MTERIVNSHEIIGADELVKREKLRDLLENLDLIGLEEALGPLSDQLIPKPATVIDATEEAGQVGVFKGETFTLAGNREKDPIDPYRHKRTVCLADKQVVIDDQPYRIEVKGYGLNGKEMFGHLHSEGDLFYGTFTENAAREFYYPQRLSEQGIDNIQKPLALLELSEQNAVRFATLGLARGFNLLMLRDVPVATSKMVKQRCRDILKNGAMSPDAQLDAIGYVLAGDCYNTYLSNGVEGLASWALQYGFENQVSGLVSGRSYGYAIRAVQSPIRVGDLHDPEIVTDSNRQIARQVGHTVRKIMELGYIDTSPNPGNWTVKGELLDFEDIVKYPDDLDGIRQEIARLGLDGMHALLKRSLGEFSTGLLADDFRYGFMNRNATEEEMAQQARQIVDSLA